MPACGQLTHSDAGLSHRPGADLRHGHDTRVDQVPGEAAVRSAATAAVGALWPGQPGQVVPRIGLMLPRRLPFAAWLALGTQLAAVAPSSAWWLGDWLAYGQEEYVGRYREAIERTGLEYQTLRNYAWVAGRIELSRRRDALSFGHHSEVAALPEPEQDFWLRKAEELGWSTARLRREVRASLAERRQEPPGPEPGPAASLHEGRQRPVRLTLRPAQLALCEQAARSHGMTLRLWAARALERAAQASLPSDPVLC